MPHEIQFLIQGDRSPALPLILLNIRNNHFQRSGVMKSTENQQILLLFYCKFFHILSTSLQIIKTPRKNDYAIMIISTSDGGIWGMAMDDSHGWKEPAASPFPPPEGITAPDVKGCAGGWPAGGRGWCAGGE